MTYLKPESAEELRDRNLKGPIEEEKKQPAPADKEMH